MLRGVLFGIMGLVLQVSLLPAQLLRFGAKVDASNNLIALDTVFRMNSVPFLIYAKYFTKTPLDVEALHVVVKSNTSATQKFTLKRGIKKTDATGSITFKEDGIYKVFVVHPTTKKTLAAKRLYITSAVNPTLAALKTHEVEYLKKQQANNTALNNKPNQQVPKNVPKTNTTTQKNNQIKTQNNQTKPQQIMQNNKSSDDDDFDLDAGDEMDTDAPDVDEDSIDLEDQKDDMSDFDDAD